MSEPNDPRVFFASERTLLAWVRTGLTIMAFGFVVARFGLFLHLLAAQSGAIGRPARVHFVSQLPKTRSGKLLRRSIQALAEGRDPGDLTTLDDPTGIEQIRAVVREVAPTR